MGRSLGSRKSKGQGQQGSVFQGCTKARKNTEKYCKNMSKVKLGSVLLGSASVLLGSASEMLGDAQGCSGMLREYS